MRPYVAIIKDSFREAMASRVLWLLLLLVTVALFALLPFHWRSSIAAKMLPQDVRNIRNISNALKLGAEADAPPLIAHVWNSLSDRTRRRINGLSERSGPKALQARAQLVENFNELIESDDFFQEELWQAATLSSRAEELLAQGSLNPDEAKQLNRLALEAALPGQLRPCPEEAMMFRYAKWDLDFVPPFGRKVAVEIIDTSLLAFMGIFVGFFGIFSGVLVTAPIVPNMLDSGSLYALISKPISRPLLFLAKFVGGCSFVFINAAYLIVGLFLILGWQFGEWKPQLLWSIPLFLFSFAIFYSVSALAGLFWRSTVMAIVATILLWVLCTTMAMTKGLMEQLIIVPDQIADVVRSGDRVFVTRRNGEVAIWNDSKRTLVEIFESKEPTQNRGPEIMMGRASSFAGMIYDEEHATLVALDKKWSQANIVVGTESAGWERDRQIGAPRNATKLMRHNGQLITLADGGVFRLSLNANSGGSEPAEQGINIFGLNIPAPAKKQPHENISEGLDSLASNSMVAYDESKGDIYVYGSHAIRRISEKDGVFREAARQVRDPMQVTHIAAQQGVVTLAVRQDDVTDLHVLSGQSFEEERVLHTNDDGDLRRLAMSSDGRWIACLFEDDELTLFDLDQGDTQVDTPIPTQGSITSAQFEVDSLVVVDVNDRIRTVSLPDMKTQDLLKPQLPVLRTLYRYLVNPVYLVCPKPAELQNTMRYALTGKDTEKVEGLGPGVRTVKMDPWQPLLSNSLFIAFMLVTGCIYVYRQDF